MGAHNLLSGGHSVQNLHSSSRNRTIFTANGVIRSNTSDRQSIMLQAVQIATMSSTSVLEAKKKLKNLMFEQSIMDIPGRSSIGMMSPGGKKGNNGTASMSATKSGGFRKKDL